MEEKPQHLEDLLQGKTIKIYWFLLTHGESGIREISRCLKVSSPSTISYHMNKLIEAGLVEKSADDKYLVGETVQSGVLGLYTKIGTLMIPRMIFYISLFVFGLIIYLLLIFSRSVPAIFVEDFLCLFFLISGVSFFSYETYRIWSMKPI